MKNFVKILAICLVVSLAFALVGCTAKPAEKKVLRLGTSADYAPYEFHKIIDGKDQIIGFDIAIAKAIAAENGYELQIIDQGFDTLIGDLKAGKLDMVIAGMTPNEERKQQVDFSEIYYKATQVVLIRKADLAKYISIDSLKGKNVGAQLTSIQEGLVKDKMPTSNLISLGKIPDLVNELKTSKVEAIVVEKPVADGYIVANSDLAIATFPIGDPEGGSAIAVQKGNKELLDKVNASIAKLVQNGDIEKWVAEANNANEVAAK